MLGMQERLRHGGFVRHRLTLIMLALALTLSMNGCGPIASFFPLYKADDRAFEAGLLGTWKLAEPTPDDPDEKNERWTFMKSGDEISYNLKLGAVGATGGILAKVRLVKLGPGLFADFEGDTGNEALESKDAVLPFPIMQTHMMGRIWLEKDSLKIGLLKDDWVKERIKAGAFPLTHLGENGDLVLTGNTEDLRKFMQEHADDKEALSEEFKLVREK